VSAKTFKIGRGTLYHWLNNLKTRGTLAPCSPPGRQRKLDLEALRQCMEENRIYTNANTAHISSW
jgi:transposase